MEACKVGLLLIVSLHVCVMLSRSLCVDALIELSDENADWKLSFDEFLNCLKPGFNPPEKSELTPPFSQCFFFFLCLCRSIDRSQVNRKTQKGTQIDVTFNANGETLSRNEPSICF